MQSSSSKIEWVAIKCSGCGMFQVGRKTKVNKWDCKLCWKKQSITKVFAISHSAKDISLFVQQKNESSLNQINEKEEEKEIVKEEEETGSSFVVIGEEYLDLNNDENNKKSEKESDDGDFVDFSDMLLELSSKRKRKESESKNNKKGEKNKKKRKVYDEAAEKAKGSSVDCLEKINDLENRKDKRKQEQNSDLSESEPDVLRDEDLIDEDCQIF